MEKRKKGYAEKKLKNAAKETEISVSKFLGVFAIFLHRVLEATDLKMEEKQCRKIKLTELRIGGNT